MYSQQVTFSLPLDEIIHIRISNLQSGKNLFEGISPSNQTIDLINFWLEEKHTYFFLFAQRCDVDNVACLLLIPIGAICQYRGFDSLRDMKTKKSAKSTLRMLIVWQDISF